jgi:hypothetical protein
MKFGLSNFAIELKVQSNDREDVQPKTSDLHHQRHDRCKPNPNTPQSYHVTVASEKSFHQSTSDKHREGPIKLHNR